MLVKVFGNASNFQSDLNFYLKVMNIGSIPNIEDLRKEFFKSFSENDRFLKKEKGNIVSSTGKNKLDEGNESLETRKSNHNNEETESQNLKVEKEKKEDKIESEKKKIEQSQNPRVELEYDEDGWSYSPVEEKGNDEGSQGFDDFDLDDDNDFGDIETGFEDDILEDEEVKSGYSEEGKEETEEVEDINDDLDFDVDEDMYGDIDEGGDDVFDDSFPDDEEFVDDDVGEDSDDLNDFNDDFDDFNDDFNDVFDNQSRRETKGNEELLQQSQDVQEKKVDAFHLTNRVVDDSWRSESEVGDIDDLWSFDDMKDAEGEAFDALLYGTASQIEDMCKKSGSERPSFSSMKSLKEKSEEVKKELKLEEEKKAQAQKEKVEEETKKEVRVETEKVEKYSPPEVERKPEEKKADVSNESTFGDRSSYKDLRDFVKLNKNCTLSDALKVFSKKEIEKEIKMGRVYQRRDKLFI